MKQPQRQQSPREPERGAVVVVVAFFLTTLFAFAAFAVDIGFRYTKSRMLQAVADSAVSAGMPALIAGNATTAGNNAATMATANGYASSYPSANITASTVTGLLSVKVTASAPSFFAAIFGGGTSRTLSATAVGALTSTPGPALLTLGGCGSSGLSESGNGAFEIKGPVESNGPMTFSTGGSAVQNFTSTVESACAVPSMGSGPITYSGGPPLMATPPPNPFSSVTLASLEPYCTNGHTTVAQDLQTTDYYPAPYINGIATLKPGVYCSSAGMNLSGPGTAFVANGVTIISGGEVTVGANNTLAGSSVLTAAAGVPKGLAIYSDATTVNCAGQAINLGSMNLVVNGSVYAPNGCANLSGDQGMAVNGSVIAQNMIIGASGDWTFDPTGGIGGTNWRMLH
jgi:hypothetical protein